MTIGRQKKIALLVFLIPGLGYLLLTRIVPLFYTVYISLFDEKLTSLSPPDFVGLENYLNLFKDARFFQTLIFSVTFTICAVGVQLLIGLGLALLVDALKKGKNILQTFLLVPMFITPVAVGTIWYIMFNSTIGPLNHIFLRLLHLAPINWLGDKMGAFFAILTTDTWEWVPFVFLIIFAALQTIDEQLYEAAKVDGASWFRTFLSVTFPLIWPPMLMAAVLRAMDAFRVFDIIYVLTQGGPGNSTESVAMLIYKTGFSWYQISYASAMAIILLVMMAVCYFTMRLIVGGKA